MILQELTGYLMRHGSAATVEAARGALMREFAALDFSRQEAVRPALRELLGPRF
jgi:2-iminoacetate synthase